MKSLKQIINRYIRSAAIVMALVILVVIAFAEILIEQGRVEDTAAGTFVRLEQIIEENENELKQIKEEYDKTCLHDAEAIAFLLHSARSCGHLMSAQIMIPMPETYCAMTVAPAAPATPKLRPMTNHKSSAIFKTAETAKNTSGTTELPTARR